MTRTEDDYYGPESEPCCCHCGGRIALDPHPDLRDRHICEDCADKRERQCNVCGAWDCTARDSAGLLICNDCDPNAEREVA